ncbi:MAG: glycosyltransferase [Prevotella sp.]|jgi:glycosyltransferase involved in cell wall biosynthesis|nr:glycosyltransferase [Prevotella sp.]
MKLSIITINYNNAGGLERTFDSVVSQGYSGFEHIVIDGGSTDASIEVIKKYGQHVTYWVSEPDNGIYNAMNKGIGQTAGEYLLFLNSGDTLCRDANLKQLTGHLTGEDIIYFNLEVCDTANNNRFIKTYPDILDFKYFAEDSLPHMGSFIKRDLLVKYGGYSEKMKIVSDWAFFVDAVCLRHCTYRHVEGYFSTFYLDGTSSDAQNRRLLMTERDNHIASAYKLYDSLYKDWMNKKQELYKPKISANVKFLKKTGLLKWLKR